MSIELPEKYAFFNESYKVYYRKLASSTTTEYKETNLSVRTNTQRNDVKFGFSQA